MATPPPTFSGRRRRPPLLPLHLPAARLDGTSPVLGLYHEPLVQCLVRLLGRQPAHQPHERHLRRHGGQRLGGVAVGENGYSGWARLVDRAQAGGAEQPRH